MLIIKNVKTGEVTNHEFGGVFVYVGLDPVSDYLTGLDITDQDGWVITDDKMATRIPGTLCRLGMFVRKTFAKLQQP